MQAERSEGKEDASGGEDEYKAVREEIWKTF